MYIRYCSLSNAIYSMFTLDWLSIRSIYGSPCAQSRSPMPLNASLDYISSAWSLLFLSSCLIFNKQSRPLKILSCKMEPSMSFSLLYCSSAPNAPIPACRPPYKQVLIAYCCAYRRDSQAPRWMRWVCNLVFFISHNPHFILLSYCLAWDNTCAVFQSFFKRLFASTPLFVFYLCDINWVF